ncbi:hypothetical protein GOODEAATRI_013443 [Goodea atripinnis]|uniref:Uncharacterized protein n=1 Tax=Goodea atripinnis TaxID=208336 RepID=A0ABV0PDW2_9TELE
MTCLKSSQSLHRDVRTKLFSTCRDRSGSFGLRWSEREQDFQDTIQGCLQIGGGGRCAPPQNTCVCCSIAGRGCAVLSHPQKSCKKYNKLEMTRFSITKLLANVSFMHPAARTVHASSNVKATLSFSAFNLSVRE